MKSDALIRFPIDLSCPNNDKTLSVLGFAVNQACAPDDDIIHILNIDNIRIHQEEGMIQIFKFMSFLFIIFIL